MRDLVEIRLEDARCYPAQIRQVRAGGPLLKAPVARAAVVGRRPGYAGLVSDNLATQFEHSQACGPRRSLLPLPERPGHGKQ